MSSATLLLTVALVGAIIYWLLVLSEGVYLGNRVVVALYDRHAPRYDEVKGVMAYEDGVHLARPLLTALQSVEAPLVLDVATGTGRMPLTLLRQFDFHGRIVGLDPAHRMLAVAQRRMASHHRRVAWVRQGAMALPFADRTFHAVTCVEALEFVPRPGWALAEMVRVLRPGGRLMVSNRVGIDALFLPGHAYRRGALERLLKTMGLTKVKTRRWQVHYDLVDAQKPLLELERYQE